MQDISHLHQVYEITSFRNAARQCDCKETIEKFFLAPTSC